MNQTDGAPVPKAVSRPNKKVDAIRAMITRSLPELAIKLSRVFEFKVTAGDQNPIALVDGETSADVSYLDTSLRVMRADPIKLQLSPKHSIELPPGVTVIIGKSGSGKTKLALERMTALNDRVDYVRYGEPLDRRFAALLAKGRDETRTDLLSFEVDVAHEIAQFLFDNGTDVLIVDSLRYLFYAGGGGTATGKGGVNMTLFADVSFLDNVANLRGKSLVLIINPLSDDDAAYKSVIEAAKGSVSALIDVQSVTFIRYTSRYEEREFKSISLPESTGMSEAPQVLRANSDMKASLKNYAH